MSGFVRLPLETEQGHPLVHKYRRHSVEATGLLALFPGNRYGVDGPLLFYPSALLGEQGWDSFAVTYGFQTAMLEPSGEVLGATLKECAEAIRLVLNRRRYPRVALMGKSLGASVVAQLCLEVPDLAEARSVYLTPLVGTPLFDSLFLQTTQPAMLALGSADPLVGVSSVEGLRASRQFDLVVSEGGDHSLLVPGDLPGSLEALRKVTEAVIAFVGGGVAA